MNVPFGHSPSITEITSLYNMCLSFNNTPKELIISERHLISLINYITFEMLNTGFVSIEQLQVLYQLLSNAKERSLSLCNLMMEYLINICCVLLLIESKVYKKQQDIKTFNDWLIKIIDISYGHLTVIDHLFYKKMILLLSALDINAYGGLSFANEHSFILDLIDMLDLSERHIDEITDSFIAELFIDETKNCVLLYLCCFDNQKIIHTIEYNSYLIKAMRNSMTKLKSNLHCVYNNYLSSFKRRMIDRTSPKSKTRMVKFEMNYLFKKLTTLNGPPLNTTADVLVNAINTFSLSYEWTYIFELIERIDKSVSNERSKLDSLIVEVMVLYSKHRFYGTFRDFDTAFLQKHFKFQNIEFPYQKLKMDFMFATFEKFRTNFPTVANYYLNHLTISEVQKCKETIFYLFKHLDCYYKLYTTRNRYTSLLDQMIIQNFFPFYSLFTQMAVCGHKDISKKCIARWKKTFKMIMTLTSSQELTVKGFTTIHHYDAFLVLYPIDALQSIIKNAFLSCETFQLEIFCTNILKQLLCTTNSVIRESNKELCVITFLFNLLRMLYFSDNGYVYYTQLPASGISPMMLADSVNVVGDDKAFVLFSAKDVLNYVKGFLSANGPQLKGKEEERQCIWKMLSYKAKRNIHFFKGQDISIVHELIMNYMPINKSKQNVSEVLSVLEFLNSICEFAAENDTRIFKGIALNQNDNFYIMKTYLHESAEALIDNFCNKDSTFFIDNKCDNAKSASYVKLFIHITKTLENYICTAYRKQSIHFGIINNILHEFILKVLFEIRCCLACQSRNDMNNITFCIFKFLSATKDIILQNPEITVLTVLLLSTLSFETLSNDFLKKFRKKFATALKVLTVKEFNPFKSVSINIQLQISIDYLIYYLLSKTKDISFTQDVVYIYHKLFTRSKPFGSGNKVNRPHRRVFNEFIKWSLIDKDVNRHNHAEEHAKHINENFHVESSFKDKTKVITVLTAKNDSKKYSLVTRSPCLDFYLPFTETFEDQKIFLRKLAHYFSYDKSDIKYEESNEEKIRTVQKAYAIKSSKKELSKEKNRTVRTRELQPLIERLDNIDTYRTFKVNIIWYNNSIGLNDHAEYSREFKAFLNGIGGDNNAIETDDKLQIKIIHYKDTVNKINFHVKTFVPSAKPLNDYGDGFQKKCLDVVSIVYADGAAEFKRKKIVRLMNADAEYKNKFYIVIWKCTSDTYHIEITDKNDNIKCSSKDFFAHVTFHSMSDCVGFIKQSLFEMVMMLNVQEQYRSSKEFMSESVVDKETINSYFSEFDPMYKRYQCITE